MTDMACTAAHAGGLPDLATDRSARWHVVQCQPRRELVAQQELAQQGFRTFLPWYRKQTRHARQTRAVRAAFFPSYLFVHLDPVRDRWRSVNGTRGVARLLASNDVPTAVPLGVVEALIERCGPDGMLPEPRALTVGRPVTVSGGPFADIVGTLERLDESGRVHVLLDMMGASILVRLRREFVSH